MPIQLISNIRWSPCATYVDAEGSQHARVLGVVCDLHERREGQLLVGEALPKVVGDEDPRALTSGHHRREDHLQNQSPAAGVTPRETSQNGAGEPAPQSNATRLMTYFPRVLGADGDAKLRSDERVVNEFGHVLKRLAVVLTGGQNPK